MKKPVIIALALITTIVSCIIAKNHFAWHELARHEGNELRDGDEENDNDEVEGGVEKEMAMWFLSRAYPDPYNLNEKYQRGWEQAIRIRKNQLALRGQQINSGAWVSLGPSSGIGGRILSIAINPVKTTTVWCGSAGGGIWKSYNSGSNWQPVVTDFPVIGVPSLIINPSDTMVMYAGTGEIYRLDSVVNTPSPTPSPNTNGYSVWKTRGTFGVGILKSINGGTTWTQVMNKNMNDLFGVQRLRFDPTNPNTVYAACTDGLYRTTDAGANWTRILALTYVSDVVINAKNNQQIVAAVGNLANTQKGIWRSGDGGATWTKITTGLPASIQGMTKMDNMPTVGNRDTIIASIGVAESSSADLYRSSDFGLTWASLSGSGHVQWQHWCAHCVEIKPSNSDSLLYGGVKLRAYKVSATSASGIITIHDDIHDIQVDPILKNIVYAACDGGMYRSTNGGGTFSSISTGLAATQFYQTLGVSATDPNFIVGGLQDNGVYRTTNGGTSWATAPGNYADGASCFVDPSNDQNVLTSGDARNVYFSTNRAAATANKLAYWGAVGDSRAAFNCPMGISKSTPQMMYVASDNWHVSSDNGVSFSNGNLGATPPYPASTPNNFIEKIHRCAVALQISPTNSSKVYVSTSPFAQADNDIDTLYYDRALGNNVLRTLNGATPFTSRRTGLPDRYVMDFAISPTNDDSVFCALAGFGTPTHIYVTGNGGASWTATTGTLPDVPFNAVVFDPLNSKIIYAGGDMGVYVSPDRGATWYDFNGGFWDGMQIMDLQISSSFVIAATHGKGIFKSVLFSGTLPVNLISFSGQNRGNYNQLRWTASQEVNMLQYELERSVDGTNYQRVTTVAAHNSPIQVSYSFDDAALSQAQPQYYYRLKMVNTDNSYTYSNVILLKRILKNNFSVLGNPFSDHIDLSYSVSSDQKIGIALYNAVGGLVKKTNLDALAGTGVYTVDNLGKLAAGMYYLKLDAIDDRKTFTLMKK
jgi:photosystem II stability/assembly factor-like uncharacterized protein